MVSTAVMERELSSVPLADCYVIHVSKRTHILRVVVPVLYFEQLWQPEDHGALQLSLKTRRPPKLRGRKFNTGRSSYNISYMTAVHAAVQPITASAPTHCC